VFSEGERNLKTNSKQRLSTVRRGKKGVAVTHLLETLMPRMYTRLQRARVTPMSIDTGAQATLDYIGEYLDVRYNVVGNDGGRFHVDVVLTNSGNRMIPSCCWAIYFYHMK